MSTLQLIFIFFVFLAVAPLIAGVAIYNDIQRLVNIIPEGMSNILVLQRKRTDLIAKLLSIVESYGIHESAITGKIAGDFGGSVQTVGGRGIVERLASLRMAFPELKADGLYETLMTELAQVESDIANRRERYNSVVRAYNITIAKFPNNLLMRPFEFKKIQFLTEQEFSS
jgi:LemA protein